MEFNGMERAARKGAIHELEGMAGTARAENKDMPNNGKAWDDRNGNGMQRNERTGKGKTGQGRGREEGTRHATRGL